MKYELSEFLKTSRNANDILNILKQQFSKVSDDTSILFNSNLQVRSIEATFGSINRSDTTIVSLNKKDGGYLCIADVHYRPSFFFWIIFIALLFTWIGWLLPIIFYLYQKNSVKQAIVDVFKRSKDELEHETPNTAPAPFKNDSLYEKIEKLASLKDKGFISEEEFQFKKTKLLNL